MTEPTPPAQMRLRGKVDEPTCRLALRATLTAAHLLGLAAGTHLRALRALRDPVATLQARLEEAELRAKLAWEILEILSARFARLPERKRPHFTPGQRFRLSEIKNLLGWNAVQAAATFLVCPNTILNWELAADPHARTAGSMVKPTPPVRRAADVVRATIQTMTRVGFGGQDLVARVLARAGWRVSARSVARYRKERAIPPPAPECPKRKTRPVIARFVHHTWMMDVTIVRRLLGTDLHVAGVFDAFSRVPLAVSVFERRPTASDMARLLQRTAKAFAAPRYVITDLGGEFTGMQFADAVARVRARQRFASADNLYATARLERFWRTLKQCAGLRLLGLPLTAEDLERRLELALAHYVLCRPHEGLEGAVPAEAFLGLEGSHKAAIEPPRGNPGEKGALVPFAITHLDEAGRFPILKLAA